MGVIDAAAWPAGAAWALPEDFVRTEGRMADASHDIVRIDGPRERMLAS